MLQAAKFREKYGKNQHVKRLQEFLFAAIKDAFQKVPERKILSNCRVSQKRLFFKRFNFFVRDGIKMFRTTF